ncbi:hypothetical protein CIY_13500 [Butyrivibrio fibrisolvens 16/4]|nr:hypothetical protein CIY_13500 [Butyrivibrio fibrisolvens 16/4]
MTNAEAWDYAITLGSGTSFRNREVRGISKELHSQDDGRPNY